MSYSKEFYLVRHGEYSNVDGHLSTMGREISAPAARDKLIARGLGVNAVLLSSDAIRAAETAEIIGMGLGVEPVLSGLINTFGNNPWTISNLDAVISGSLGRAGVEIDSERQDLIVVTHAPMLAIASGVESSEVKYGEVFAYARDSWNNPHMPN